MRLSGYFCKLSLESHHQSERHRLMNHHLARRLCNNCCKELKSSDLVDKDC